MPFPADRHPEPLKQAVGQALLAGDYTAPALVRALNEGTFQDFGPYVLPLATARYYGQQARKREKAAGLTKRAKGTLNDAVEDMAREILSELDQELHTVRRAKHRDMEKLGAIAKLLKEVKALAPNAGPKTAAAKKQSVPVDPFTAALSGSVRAMPSKPKAQKEEAPSEATGAPSKANTETAAEPTTDTNTSQVLSRAPWL